MRCDAMRWDDDEEEIGDVNVECALDRRGLEKERSNARGMIDARTRVVARACARCRCVRMRCGGRDAAVDDVAAAVCECVCVCVCALD